ncbi:MAG: cytochrome d ubiquinol oxidase subunit II [Bacteroidales bacterium]|jgi:cytochrome d ubiquinol oxidase subunit II|nr:cytochrome d ubiquinol oxidase subunit II [Bacteroidales bacterium]
MDYNFFIQYWWFIISLLGAILVFLLFVQGGESLIPVLGKNELEETMLINSIGRKWEFTFTTLVTFGGAFFAAFPLFYSTSFGGAYWLWMIILFCFILQAVSFEFRKKENNLFGTKTYNIFLMINGFGATFLLGVVVGSFFSGNEFMVNKDNITNVFAPIISVWTNPLNGIEALFKPFNLLLGFAVLTLSRTLALLYYINNINDETIQKRAKKHLYFSSISFLAFFITFLILLCSIDGYQVNNFSNIVELIPHKYFYNFIDMPLVLIMLLLGVVLVLYGILRTLIQKKLFTKGIWFCGIGTILVVLSLFLVAGYNNTAYYPSTFNIQSSLTIYNSSSSAFTLKVMSWVSLLIPFVFAYIFYCWRKMDKKKITKEEMQNKEEHQY